MNSEYIRKNLTIDDLGENQRLLFEALGKEKYIELCHIYGGSQISIPTEETLRCGIAKRKIKENKELIQAGNITMRQLAMMHKVSLSLVYRILREKK